MFLTPVLALLDTDVLLGSEVQCVAVIFIDLGGRMKSGRFRVPFRNALTARTTCKSRANLHSKSVQVRLYNCYVHHDVCTHFYGTEQVQVSMHSTTVPSKQGEDPKNVCSYF
jgi:hypothetical protein